MGDKEIPFLSTNFTIDSDVIRMFIFIIFGTYTKSADQEQTPNNIIENMRRLPETPVPIELRQGDHSDVRPF